MANTLSLSLLVYYIFPCCTRRISSKIFCYSKAETIALKFAKPLIWFCILSYGINSTAIFFTKLFGLEPAKMNLPILKRLRLILGESFKSDEINQTEYKYVNNIFEFDDRVAKNHGPSY